MFTDGDAVGAASANRDGAKSPRAHMPETALPAFFFNLLGPPCGLMPRHGGKRGEGRSRPHWGHPHPAPVGLMSVSVVQWGRFPLPAPHPAVLAPPAVPPPGETPGFSVLPQPGRNPLGGGQLSPLLLVACLPHPPPPAPQTRLLPPPTPSTLWWAESPGERRGPPSPAQDSQEAATKGRHLLGWG